MSGHADSRSYERKYVHNVLGERSGSVVECLTRDQGAADSSFTAITALCPLARRINPSLELV